MAVKTYQSQEINRLYEADPRALVNKGERSFHRRLNLLVDELYDKRNQLKIVLLTGPSASGKTTTANLIAKKLGRKGVSCDVISLDNFYKNRDDVPLDKDGKPDLESVHALDVRKINSCFKKLVTEGRAEFPVFDFITGCCSDKKTEVFSGDGELVIVEGIHALNPAIRTVGDEDRYYKVYISPRRPFLYGEEEIISPSGLRLMRRMLRDFQRRGSSVGRTLSMWDSVRAGEKKYIFPHLGTEDFFVETTHLYEPLLYREKLYPLLETVAPGDEWYDKAQNMMASLRYFDSMNTDLLPPGTLMKEFMDL